MKKFRILAAVLLFTLGPSLGLCNPGAFVPSNGGFTVKKYTYSTMPSCSGSTFLIEVTDTDECSAGSGAGNYCYCNGAAYVPFYNAGASAEVVDATIGDAGNADLTHAYSKDDVRDYLFQHDPDYDGLPDGVESGAITDAMLAATLDLSSKTITFGLVDGDVPTTLTLETISGTPVITNGVAIGTDDTNHLIDEASNGAGSATLYIGNESILVSGDIGVTVQGYDANTTILGSTIGASEVDADIATQAELDAVAALVDTGDEIIAIINASPSTQIGVPAGGTGAGTFTDGGLLVGAGTGAFEALTVGLTTEILVGGGAGTNPAWGTDLPAAVTIGTAYIYRVGGTDVADADVADDITLTNITQITNRKLDDLGTPDDNTDLNATTTYHGLLPKLDNNSAHFLDGTGAWSTPAGGGNVSASGTPAQYQWAEWTDATTIKGTAVTGNSVVKTDTNGSPVACSNIADIAYQPADIELSVIAGLTSAANKIPYFTGSGTGDLLDFATTVGNPGSDTTIVSEQGIREAISALSSTYLALAGTGIMTGDLVFTEAADHSSTPGAGYGYLWVRNDAPTVLVFTDDTGADTVLGSGGSGETNTASSQGSGTSVYYQKSGVDIQLNAIKSESDDITVSLDGVSHDIEITFVPGNVGLNELASGVPNLAADSIDTITEIASALKSGADGTLITGTAGTSGYVALWNSDGDIIDGYDPTSKADVAGETFTGLIITNPSDATEAGFRLGHGTAPSAPTNGDIWTTTAGLYARINGATVGPFGTGGNTALDDIAVPDAAVSLALGAYQHLFSLSADTSAFRLGSATDYFEFVRSGTDYIFRIVDGGSDGNIYAQLGTLTIVDEGIAIQTGESDADYFSLAAYDLDGAAQVSLLRPVASNTPHLELGPASNHLQVSQAGVVSFAGTSYIANIELGAADDTTITRTGAGAIAVEGVAVLLSGGALGTPSSGTGTNLTGIPISTGLTGAGTGVLDALAVNVGSAGAPVLYNGALGQPSSGDGTNILTPSSTSLPGTCTVGQQYIDTDADTNGSLYICVSTDTWKEVDDDGSGGVAISGTPAQYQWAEWVDSSTIKGTAVTGSSVVCTDANGSPVACSNLTDTAFSSYLAIADIDDTPVDSETSAPISSNWAYDHNVASATTSVSGHVEYATTAETTTGTDNARGVTPDGLSGSVYGQKEIGWIIHDSDVATAVADGKQAASIPASMNGMNLIDVTCSIADQNSASGGATTVVLRRVRAGTPQDMTSTGVTIAYNEYTASDETVDGTYDDVQTGDSIYVDVNAVTTGAAQLGLSCTAVFQTP